MKHNQLIKTAAARTGKDVLELINKSQNKFSGNGKEYKSEGTAELNAIWESLLGHSNFTEADDFFQVGGNSLKAVQLVSRISGRFSVNVELADIFSYPVFADQNRMILHKKPGGSEDLAIGKTSRPEHIPLSYSQERLWFIDQMEGSIHYHIPATIRITGSLNKKALEKAIQVIVNRHEVLRTVFFNENGKSFQHVNPEQQWQFAETDKYQTDSSGLQLYIHHLIESPFDLSGDYMLRATLINLSPEEHLLVVVMHHIASDGWSMGIIIKEVLSLYRSFAQNEPIALRPLDIQYADYAIWQRGYLQGEILLEKINYWKSKLEGVATLQLPTDYPRPSVQSTRGASKAFSISKELTVRLNQLSQQEGATLFMVLLAGFKILLHKYSGQEDICVGTPVANRIQQETEELVGFFVNTLALRSEVRSPATFKELLQEVKATTLEAYSHQDVPFEKVVEAVVKERDLSRSPLFQVLLVLQNTPDMPELALEGLQLSEEPLPVNTSKFELTFTVTENEKGLACQVEYNTDLYKEETIERMISHYKKLLESIVVSPGKKISQLEMLTSEDTNQLLEEFNGIEISYPKDKNIIDLFETQVAKTPGNIAVVCEDESITYEKLNKKANQLAHYLKNKGVKADTLVPICVERNIDMIIGLLGILKAGGAYVPVDPEYPEDRISYMLEDTGAAVVISSTLSKQKLTVKDQVEIIEIHGDNAEINAEPTINLAVKIIPNNLAYIIYTSGSTGKPKGVMIEHKNVVRLFETDKPLYDFTEKDVWTMFHSFCFDFSVWEMYGALLYGGRLVMVPSNIAKDTSLFSELLLKEKVTILNQTPSAFYVLQEMLTNKAEAVDIRYVIFGGEALDPSKLRPWKSKYSNSRLINMYGITETTVHVTYQEIGWPQIEKGNSVIGKPIPTLSAYILDQEKNLLPIGIPGELCIGGAGVARGYLNREALTKEKFIKNPFAQDGSKLYRSGDLGRWQADGTIEYLGRIDDQVKIRGYRIELGEIENVIQQSGQVKQAVVLARQNKEGSKHLAAYVVPKDEYNKEALTAYLHSKLPEYMVPAIFVELATIPLTSNGKVDKKSLPNPDLNELLKGEYVAPRNTLEGQLAATWQNLLGIERVGINDNFFELGGHSLLAMQLTSVIRKELDIEIPIKDLFVYPTISLLSANLRQYSKSFLPAIKPQPRPEHIPLSFSQERLWFIDQMEGSVQYHIPGALRLKGKLNKEALINSLCEIVQRHEVLRTILQEENGEKFQKIVDNSLWSLDIKYGTSYQTDVTGLQSYIAHLIESPFDLSRDHMLRATLISISPEEHLLVVVMHHIASDGWSMGIIIKEVLSLYRSFAENEPVALKPLDIQYADYAIWQRNYLQGEILSEKINYWKSKLEGVATLQLPTDYPRPSVQSTRGASKAFSISKELTGRLNQLSQQEGATLFMVLLAGFKILLHKYSGQEDICVGTPVANRTQQETEELVGFFVNTLALRSEVRSLTTFKELLQEVKATTLEAYSHQDVPFEKVVEAVVKERDLSCSPLFQALLVLQNTPNMPELALGGLHLSEEPLPVNTSKFELTFTVIENEKGLACQVDYNTDLYREETIERMISHFTELLSSITGNPTEKISGLKMLSGEEELQVLITFNDTEAAYPKDKSIVAIFEEQAAAHPDSVALIFENEEISYKELNEKSNQVARYLRRKGVQEETLVPISIERSVAMMTGIMGILKAGGAYVPIDPAYPAERISFMLEDTSAKVILSSSSSVEKLPISGEAAIIEIDKEQDEINHESTENISHNISAGNLAYIIYTSGSTGRPKGVMVTHNNVVSLVKGTTYAELSSKDRLLSTGSSSFDATTFEYWGMLLNGGRLILCEEAKLLNSERLKEEIRSRKVNKMWFTSSWFNQLVETDISIFEGLEAVLAGGEKLSNRHIEKFRKTYPQTAIINGYGPTENTTFSLTYKITETGDITTIPIGRPLQNRTAYVLGEDMEVKPVGVPGEIYLGGAGVARGYLNREELTAEKFVPNPFDKQNSTRLYKTGDIGRWLEDGTIEYLGRRDEQVKIRGYRIELGEIESILQQSGLVKHAVVIARADSLGTSQLVGYIVPEESYDKEAVTTYLLGKLPDYMVPSVLIELEQLPLTANGKVDKRALPDPEDSEFFIDKYVPAETEFEEKMVSIWEQLLQKERIGIKDNFFELGGHSLLAMQLTSIIRKELEIDIPVKDLFVYPTISLLTANLSQYSRSLLPAIKPQLRPEHIPLSFSQERLWFIDQMEGSVQYHIPAALRLKGTLDKEALSKTLQAIINRHEVLRTVFQTKDGQAFQQIKDKDLWALNEIDGSKYKNDEDALQTIIAELINEPFDLSNDHMFRATLIALAEDEHLLVVVMHHIASDGWSIPILIKELDELYAGYSQGNQFALPPLKIQYADYSIWQRDYLKGDVLENKISYWKEKLEGVTSLQIPTDFPRPSVQSTRGAFKSYQIEKKLGEQLNSLSRQQGATLFMTMLAGLNVLLHRYSGGQEDICVGSPIANRGQQEVEELIGFFINTLALRNEVKGEESFNELLQQIKETTLGAYEHQDVPLEKIVEAVVKERDLSRSPLFNVVFVLQNTAKMQGIKLGDLSLKDEPLTLQTAKFDLTFSAVENEDGLQCWVEYNTDLYKEETIEKMISHYKKLLESIVVSPEKKIAELDMLTEEEKNQLLEEFNGTEISYPKDKNIIDLFETQVAKTPGNIAVVCEGESITYEELNKRANQLAHYLKNKGVKADTLVPICVERNIDMIIGLLGILKAGGAYVPVDPEYPEDRISYMLEDTGAALVISSTLSRQKLSVKDDVEIIEIDGNNAEINAEPTNNPEVKIAPENLAYIIYTSGSTGKPKGVMIEHKNVVRLFETDKPLYDFTEKDVWTMFHSFCFDFSVWEMYGALLYGGKLVMVPSNIAKDTSLFSELLLKEKVTILNQTPSAFYVLQEMLTNKAEAVDIRYVIFGGEALDPSKLRPWKSKYSNSRLINMYGITETTVHVTYQEIGWPQIEKGNSVIGKPIPTLSAYILDQEQNLLSIGIPGELCIGGAGVARGYLNREALTKEKFIANPFTQDGSKLYRSGDLGRWQADGTIEYLGRIDDQVKIRGYRIELGEIENVIQQSGQVKQAVVLARQNKEGSKHLVAYVVPKDEYNKEALTAYLHSKLPDYMVPAIFVELATMPLTSNGKVDKKSLPNPDLNELLKGEYVAPRNTLEEQLANTWQDLLGVERVGIHDNFFELGGDSILTIQVVSRIRKAGYELQPKDLFINQTIARLSSVLADRSAAIISGEQGLLEGNAGLLPIQQWFLEKQSSGISHYNQSVLLKIDKSITEKILNDAIGYLSNHHDALRFEYSNTKNTWQQKYGETIPSVIVEIIDSKSNGQQPFLISAICNKYQRSLDIENGRIFRAVLIETSGTETQNRLFIVVHHLAIDGVSWRILVEDLELLLSNLASGKEINLGHKTSSYRQWYNALENYSQSQILLSQKKYWQKAITGQSALVTDHQYKGVIKISDTALVNQKLGRDKTSNLIKDVSRAYHTEINDLLLAALAKTIVDFNKKEKIIIGLEGHGREEISTGTDITRTVGWFTSMYPLPLEIDASAGKNTGALIKTVKEQLRQVPGKGIGYGVLKYINKEESLQGNEPWEIVFNYLGQVDNVVKDSKWFGVATESTGDSLGAEIEVGEKLSINSIISNGELRANWTYSTKHFTETTVQKLAANYISNLETIIDQCHTQQANGEVYTPSDYGLEKAVDYKELDNFLDEKSSSGKIRRDEIDGLYSLSGLQQGMLFHNLYDGEAAAYTIQLSWVFSNLNVEFLLQSWKAVIQNHTILRTAFYYDKFNIPVQYVHKEVLLPFEQLDYRGMNADDQSAAMKAYEQAEREKGFDFTKPPLMRIVLIRLGEDRYWMLWTYHHIILDGWSLPILMEEFLSIYKSLVLGQKVELRPVDRFEDYIRYIERKDEADQKAYWKDYLKDVEAPTLLPFIESSVDRNRGAGEYKSAYLEIEAATTDLIKTYAQNHHITVNTLVQGAWSYLLHSYTGANDVVFGVTVSGRPDDLPGVEHGVGLYINPLPLHAKIAKDQTINDWLKTIQKEQVSSRQFQNTPLSKIQEWSDLEGDLFDCLLTFENYPVSKLIGSNDWGLQIEDVQTYDKNNYPLTILIGLAETLHVRFSYNETLLAREYMEMIIGHFKNVLLHFVNNNEGLLKDVQFLTTAEKTAINSHSNKEVFYPKDSSVVSLFEAQVGQTPDAIALVFEDEKYTFQELNEKSNQLAHYLKSKGVGAETLVPLFIERSACMIVGMMGILKAGAAYVPIDTEFPAERISFMLEDTYAKIVVSSEDSADKLGELDDIEIVAIDEMFSPVKGQPKMNPEIAIEAKQLAYLIYTSGSTGNPKGVMVEHGNLVDYVYGLKDATGIDQCKSFALMSTIATDLGNTVLYSSLLFGGALHVFTKEATTNIYRLHEYFEEHAIECIKIVPSHWKALSKDKEPLLPTKLLVFGGEALHSEIVTQIGEANPGCQVVNHYGPTETTIGKLLQVVQKGMSYGKTVPIGKPFSNTKVYVLNKDMELCAVGVPGQLFIAGDGVARGYLNNEALTASKFIQDPFENGSLMYSTGDLVKYLPNGNIEFIGRVDNQVKIRGYRIELGEIENVLQQCELVKQAVVLAKEDKQNNKRLLAYIVPQHEFDRDGIYDYLKEKLPDYMLPAVMMEIAELPLTANGKIDRKALPDPESGDIQTGVYTAASNDVEEKLVEIWQEILEVEPVGIHDDFFELGGHSLLAIRLISMIRKELGLEVKIGDVFDYPTIALLSKRINEQDDRALLPTIEVKERPARIPLSFSQERLWFIDQLDGSTQYHLPTILRLKGKLNIEALNYSLQLIVNRHEVLRTVFKEENGIPYQQVKEDDSNTLQEIAGNHFKENDQQLYDLIKQLVKMPFDLSKDNMLKVYLIELAPEDYVLVAVMHHISSDAWSTSIMVKEVAELYNSFIENRQPQLPAMDLQYADYSIWQRNNLKGDAFEKKIAYWREKMKGVAVLELPTDNIRPSVLSTKGAFVNFSIDKEISDQVKQLSQKEGTTLFIVLQAVYKAMLYRYSGQQDISVGTSIARREQHQLESLIGFFVNTLALRDEVNGESTFMELLQQVKATTMEAYEHQEVSFEKVVEVTLKERDKSRSPLFQVMLVLINTPEVNELHLGDIELTTEAYEQTTVKFEITFFIRETANGFEGTVQYYTDLYKEETIKRMIVHFNELLKSVISNPNEKIDLLQMLTEEEEQQLLMEFN